MNTNSKVPKLSLQPNYAVAEHHPIPSPSPNLNESSADTALLNKLQEEFNKESPPIKPYDGTGMGFQLRLEDLIWDFCYRKFPRLCRLFSSTPPTMGFEDDIVDNEVIKRYFSERNKKEREQLVKLNHPD
jgi:hypothetical protein